MLLLARSVLITLEAYLVFFSASFFSSSLSTGIDKLDGALAWVIRTSMNVFSFFPYCRLTTYRHRFARAAPAPRGRASPVNFRIDQRRQYRA